MKGILKDLKLKSFIPKFAAERIKPENVSELSDDELVRLDVTTIGDCHCLRALCANTEKNHQSMATAALSECVVLFSGCTGSSRRGGHVVRKEKFLRRELDSNSHLFSQPPSIENSVVERKASAWARHNGSVNSKCAHPPGHLLGISIQCNFIHTSKKFILHYI